MADLDAAIALAERTLRHVASDRPNRAKVQSDLNAALQARHRHTGALADLEAAIAVGLDAEAAMPHPEPGLLTNLGSALYTHYLRTEIAEDLDRAIALLQRAIDEIPPDHPDRATCLSNLGPALASRHRLTKAPADLDAAVTVGRQAVDAMPPDHPDYAASLANLGIAMATRYTRGGAPADLEDAVATCQAAADAAAADDPARAGYLANLGRSLRQRHARTGSTADLDRALSVFREALRHPTAPPMIRARAGREGAAVAAERGDWTSAELVFDDILAVLPMLVDHGLDPRDRQHHLAQLQNLAADAVRATLGDTGQRPTPDVVRAAWRRHEQARTVLLAQALEIRHADGIDRLEQTHPHLAAEYHKVRGLLSGEASRP
ncbi:tetratricopeptide repeat protein [Dactylosporangium cerinum]